MRSLLLLACVACGSSSRPTAAPVLPKPVETPPTIDEVRAVVRDAYTQLGQGYDSVYLEGLTQDARLTIAGVRPEDLLSGYDASRAIEVHRLFGDAEIELVSKELEVHLARDGTAAWIADDLSYRVLSGRRRAFLPLRETALYERREGRWRLLGEALSYPIHDPALAASGLWKLTASTGLGEEGDLVKRRIIAVLTGDDSAVSLEDDALVIGPADERAHGREVGKIATPASFFPARGAIEPTGIRVALARSGTVAWAAATFVFAGAKTTSARASFVLEKRGG